MERPIPDETLNAGGPNYEYNPDGVVVVCKKVVPGLFKRSDHYKCIQLHWPCSR